VTQEKFLTQIQKGLCLYKEVPVIQISYDLTEKHLLSCSKTTAAGQEVSPAALQSEAFIADGAFPISVSESSQKP